MFWLIKWPIHQRRIETTEAKTMKFRQYSFFLRRTELLRRDFSKPLRVSIFKGVNQDVKVCIEKNYLTVVPVNTWGLVYYKYSIKEIIKHVFYQIFQIV